MCLSCSPKKGTMVPSLCLASNLTHNQASSTLSGELGANLLAFMIPGREQLVPTAEDIKTCGAVMWLIKVG